MQFKKNKTKAIFSHILLCFLIIFCIPNAVFSDEGEIFSPGLQPGEKISDFQIPDQHNVIRDFASLTGPKGLIVVIHRSADW